MIRDAEVGAVLQQLPERSFIRNYCWYAAHCTDAPMVYHAGTALALLSIAAPMTLCLNFGTSTYAPQWPMLVGASGGSHKTSALGIGLDIAAQALPGKIGPTPGSVQGLHEYLQEQGTCLIPFTEFGDFLASSVKGGVLAPLREALTNAWDCRKIDVKLAKSRRQIENPRVSLAACVAPIFLETHTTQTDWEGGFLSRFFVLYAEREHTYILAPGLPGGEAFLVNKLAEYPHYAARSARGMERDAQELYESWFMESIVSVQRDAEPWAQGLMHRAPAIAQKTALMHAFDLRAQEMAYEWYLQKEDIAFGIEMAAWHIRSATSIVSNIASSKAGQQRKSVIRALEKGDMTIGEIIRHARPELTKWEAQRILETLCEAQYVFARYDINGPKYSLKKSDELSFEMDDSKVLPFRVRG